MKIPCRQVENSTTSIFLKLYKFVLLLIFFSLVRCILQAQYLCLCIILSYISHWFDGFSDNLVCSLCVCYYIILISIILFPVICNENSIFTLICGKDANECSTNKVILFLFKSTVRRYKQSEKAFVATSVIWLSFKSNSKSENEFLIKPHNYWQIHLKTC